MNKSKEQSRRHLPLSPEPMYVDNSHGRKCYDDLGLKMQQKRIKSKLNVKDMTEEDYDE